MYRPYYDPCYKLVIEDHTLSEQIDIGEGYLLMFHICLYTLDTKGTISI